MNDFKNQRAYGVAIWDVFSETVSKCAGHAMSWLLTAYKGLESVDMKSSLRRVGYDKCWDCPEFRAHALARLDAGQQAAAPDTDLDEVSRNEGGWDHEDEIHQELLLQIEEHNADPEQDQFFGEAINPE